MTGTGNLRMAEAFIEHNMLVALEKFTPPEEIISFYRKHTAAVHTAIPTIGLKGEDEQRLSQIFAGTTYRPPSMIVIDVPNGHMRKMVEAVKYYRAKYPETVIVAGNVATGSMARKLVEAGADVVKVGIGPGSACTTKRIAGVHRPQFAAVRECAVVAHSLGAYVICDGGIVESGDAIVAFAAGADFIMIGGMYAAHDQSGNAIYMDENGVLWQKFMGSSSAEYQAKTNGGMETYKASEGAVKWVRHKGDIMRTVENLLGGIRSGASYAGASDLGVLAEMARKTYQGKSGGVRLVKAEIPPENKSDAQPVGELVACEGASSPAMR